MGVKEFEYKYYKFQNGEASNPNVGKDENAALWWEGEKSFNQQITAKSGTDFINRLEGWYDDAFKDGSLRGSLGDITIPKSKRLLLFYLDLWHGKWYPYDDPDQIFKY